MSPSPDRAAYDRARREAQRDHDCRQSPRALARYLDVVVPGNDWGYDAVYEAACQKAVDRYWQRRIVHGPRCGTSAGYGDHGNGPKCQPCQDAERRAIPFRQVGEVA